MVVEEKKMRKRSRSQKLRRTMRWGSVIEEVFISSWGIEASQELDGDQVDWENFTGRVISKKGKYAWRYFVV